MLQLGHDAPLIYAWACLCQQGPTYVIDAISAKCWLDRSALIINPMGSFSEAKPQQRVSKSTERNDAAVTIIITEAPQCISRDSS